MRLQKTFSAVGFLSLVSCLLGLLPRIALATDYFISPSGDDSATGASPDTAWSSIARVNTNNFRPGDRILFQANESFPGNLHLDSRSAGDTNAPVVISSFGNGKAKILAGRDTGITIESAGWITISNLIVAGDGPTNNAGYGILFDNRLEEFRRLEHIQIENVEASGFGVFGILVSGKQAGFHHVRVIDCDVHHNLRGGMEIAGKLAWDSPSYAHSDVEVTGCNAHDNLGDPNYDKNHSGSGMVLYEVDGGRFENCRAWGNGAGCRHGNGGVGIWSCVCRSIVIDHCESFANRTHGGDGGGFDLDGGSTDCVLQYNYSHDNDGPGLMVYTYAYAGHSDTGSIVRFNVSDNDAARGHRYAGLWVRSDGGAITGLKVYNNTVRSGVANNPAAYVDGNGVEGEFRNNILIGGDAAPLAAEHPQPKLQFMNNLYWSGGAPLKIQWGDATYADLPAWRQATLQETADGKPLGVIADPQFSGGVSQPAAPAADWIQRLTPYKPARQSTILNQGIPVEPNSQSVSDILGGSLTVNYWPLGAIGSGSM